MMARQLRHIRRMFIVWQGVILVGTVGLVTGLFLSASAQSLERRQRDRLNDVAVLIVNQMEMQNENPPGQVDPYKVFVIDAEDGSYVFPRPEDSEQDRALWESHRVKLIYQMQKRRQGWIVYPEGVNSTRSDYHVLRYLSMKTTGWIVVVEAVFPSRWHLVQEVGNKDLFLKIGTVLLIALFFIKVLTGRWFAVMKKVIADSLESNLMNVSHEEIWGRSAVEEALSVTEGPPVFSSTSELPSSETEGMRPIIGEEQDSGPSLAASKDETVAPMKPTTEKAVLTDPFPYEESPPDEEDVSPTSPLMSPSLEVPPAEKKTAVNAPKPSSSSISFENTSLSEGTGRKPETNEMKIDVRGIRSPVLRKMIEELRSKD